MFFFFDLDKNNPEYEQLLLLNKLIERFEYELVEFKEASNNYSKDEIGKYFSAISNEANLNNQQYGWLIFGVRNKDKTVVGTDYRNNAGLDRLKQEIADSTIDGISFIDIIEVYPVINGEKRRVVMFKIPAAPTGIPTSWKGHLYARNGESLYPMSIEKQERIRRQQNKDWSKQIVDGATIEHLDKEAILLARESYKKKANKEHITIEVNRMNDLDFLTKLKLIENGKVTNAAMVLLGNSDFDNKMERPPHVMWRLYGANGFDKDYEIFDIPFITVVDKAYKKIRNLKYRYLPNQLTLFPTEVNQYDQSLLKELLNNCIAHSDYATGGRIYVNEFEDDKIKISNPGVFLPGDIEVVLDPSYSPPYYKNQLLAETMAKLSMIDTATMGIRKIFNIQKERFFPLPDYDFSTANQVLVTIYGKVLNENYTRLLYNNQDFDLETVFLLDKVQKNEPISADDIKSLREKRLIEGKKPNLYISASVAKIVGEKEQYIKNKGFDDEYYKKLIIDYLTNFNKGKKTDFIKLLFNKLPDVLDEKQKEAKVRNLLSAMKAENIIDTDSANRRISNWVLVKKD